MPFFIQKKKQEIRLFNTKGREKQVFKSLKPGEVRMYSCGPTVYDYVHIGNLRAYVTSDVVRRVFEYAGYKVVQVINITDFGHLASDSDEGEDKMTKGLKREGLEFSMQGMKQLADKYISAVKEDLVMLNFKTPSVMPRASEHVLGMIAYVETLLHKGYAYTTSDGVYFDSTKFSSYGALGGSASGEHSRVGVNPEKRSVRDFALWKFNSEMGWDAPWGKGFPGWHIECTAMATRYLGKSFDIHTGGIDLSATHHNNEIAQAECANGKPYATYWLHNEFVTIENQKISKSLGNTINLRQVIDKGINPLAYRYWLLTGHYRSPMNFTWEPVFSAQTALQRAWRIFTDLRGSGKPSRAYLDRFEAALYDDFNTAEGIAVLWEALKDDSLDPAVKKATVLSMDAVLGVGFRDVASRRAIQNVSVETDAVPDTVKTLLRERESARATGDFVKADELRQAIEHLGFKVEDSPKGPVVKGL